ncbi:hypothetical protein NXH76_20270 [Blautia schinkii]|nr:hypothetical protein [Blautia schinkii]
MAKNITLPHAAIGDILAVSNAGSYGCTLTPLLFQIRRHQKNFYGQRRMNNGKYYCIV